MSFYGGSSLTVLRLCYNLCLRPEYNNFRSRLGEFLPPRDGPTPPTTNDNAIDAALEVLQTERERKEAEKNEDCDEMADGIGASATDQDVEMMDAANQPQALVGKVDNALEILVRNATEEFGFAPSDVYSGFFELPTARGEHPARGTPFITG